VAGWHLGVAPLCLGTRLKSGVFTGFFGMCEQVAGCHFWRRGQEKASAAGSAKSLLKDPKAVALV
jgi:hypothetical protein